MMSSLSLTTIEETRTTVQEMSTSSFLLLTTATYNESTMANSSSIWDTGQNGTVRPELFNASTVAAETDIVPNWPVLSLLVVMALGLAANLLVLVVVSCSPRLHVPFYVFTASLATSDLLKALTVMPLSILRLLLGGAVPPWMCWAWSRLYLCFTSLTLSHIIVALLHCHLSLYKPLLFRHFSDPSSMAVQVAAAWVLPVLLLIPYLVFTGPGTLRVMCLPLDTLYFISGVFPTVVIPILIAAVVYMQAVITIKNQKKVAQQMQSNNRSNSEVSSNGFVTYENSSASEDGVSPIVRHRALNGQASLNGQAGLNGHASMNRQPSLNGQAGHISHHEVIIHDALPYDDISAENPGPNAPDKPDATKDAGEMVDTSSTEGSSEQINQDNPTTISADKDVKQDCDLKSGSGQAHTDETCTNEDKEASPVHVDDKTDGGDGDLLEDASRKVVHVKCKVGKEALNEPLEDGAQVQLQLASFIMSQADRLQGVDNPAFDADDADLPLCASIKARALVPKGEQEDAGPSPEREGQPANGLQVTKSSSESSPYGVSRTSSFSGDDTSSGCRSILKRDRVQGSSTKSVTFTLPEGADQQTKRRRGRLLSCKYKTKDSNKVRHTTAGTSDDLSIRKAGGKGGAHTTDPTTTPVGVGENLATSANFRYMAQVQKDQGLRLRSRVQSHSRHVKVLLAMFILCVVFAAPHLVSMVALSYNLEGTWESTLLLSVLEWLAFVPFIVYPFIYISFSANFRTAMKTMGKQLGENAQ